jgi:hypothetical protein
MEVSCAEARLTSIQTADHTIVERKLALATASPAQENDRI